MLVIIDYVFEINDFKNYHKTHFGGYIPGGLVLNLGARGRFS